MSKRLALISCLLVFGFSAPHADEAPAASPPTHSPKPGADTNSPMPSLRLLSGAKSPTVQMTSNGKAAPGDCERFRGTNPSAYEGCMRTSVTQVYPVQHPHGSPMLQAPTNAGIPLSGSMGASH